MSAKIQKDIEKKFEFSYMMLGRLQTDLDYYFGNGKRCDKSLYYQDINTHLEEVKKLHASFPDGLKPKWLTLEQIAEYEANAQLAA
ncbi:MAG: hypothetical protein ACJAS1_001638 [Oleiphilaceae bacterium]|jgi:hypothetical protein